MSVQSELAGMLQRFLENELAAEGITPDVLDSVMLDIEYSPVITMVGGDLKSAATVRPWGFYPDDVLPEKFEVEGRVVDRDQLKVMRARYLLARDRHFKPMYDELRRRFTK